MRVYEFRGRDLNSALLRAHSELGEKAIVISRKNFQGGVALAVAQDVPRNAQVMTRLRTEAADLLKRATRNKTRKTLAPSTVDVERSLRTSGCSEQLIATLISKVNLQLETGEHPLDIAAREIATTFPAARAKRIPGKVQVMAFIGHTGVGKTTSIAKLGARLVRAGRRVALATLDSHRVGAVEQLRAFGGILGAPVTVVRDMNWLTEAAATASEVDVILLDTSGNIGQDTQALASLRSRMEEQSLPLQMNGYLVLSAANSVEALRLASQASLTLGPVGSVITKLDETKTPGSVLEHTLDEGLPIAFMSDGVEIASHFHRPTGDILADLLLRGRIL